MEQFNRFKFSFKCKILRVFNNGFTALERGYLIKFLDEKNRPLFFRNDEIHVAVEDAEEIGQEIHKPNYMVIYCVLKNYLSNGFQFIDTYGQQKGFFWNYRGVLTHKLFESEDIWERDTLLRIMMRKI